MFFNFIYSMGLHSHSFSVSTHLFNFFIANFIAESDETRRVRERWLRFRVGLGSVVKKLILIFIILSSCSTPNSRSDAYYEAVAGHIAQTVLSGDCNSKCISSIVNSNLKYATYTQAINVIDKVSKLLPSIYDAIKKELVVRVDEKYKKEIIKWKKYYL